MRIALWKADVIGLYASRHYLVAAPDGYTAKCEAIRESAEDGLHGRREIFVTHLLDYPPLTASVGEAVARRDAEATGLLRAQHVPRLNPQHLVDPALQAGLRAANGNDPSSLQEARS